MSEVYAEAQTTGRPYLEVCHSQERKRWLDARRSGIGASDMPAILGESSWASPLSVYTSKIHPAEDIESERFELAHAMEPVVMDVYQRRTQRKVRPCGMLLRHGVHQWAMATPDAWTDVGFGAWRPLELKTSSPFALDAWSEGPPRVYWWQVQHQMLVTGAPLASIACLVGSERFIWADVERDDQAIDHLIRVGEDFWEAVAAEEPPPPDGSAATRRALAELYPEDTGEIVTLPVDLAEADTELVSIKAQLKDLDARKHGLESEIKAAIGDATKGVIPGGASYSWKLQSKKAQTIAASQFRVLRRHKRRD